jgi:hypothetical protein
VVNTADIKFLVDGPVSNGIAPIRIAFRTVKEGYWSDSMVVKSDGKVGINTLTPTSLLQVVGLPVYESNTEATNDGLTPGAFYRTALGVLMVVFE